MNPYRKYRTFNHLAMSSISRAFSDSTKLSEHLRTHTGERPFQCTQCGLTFSFQSTLSIHRKTHLREENVTEEEANMRLYYVCEVCGKNFRSNGALKTHKLYVHDGFTEEVPCDVCGKSFRTRELLKQHQEREHSASPKFVCDTCGQRFGNNYHLRRHEALHTDEEFPCAFCSRRFKRKDGLDAHMSTIHDNHQHNHHPDHDTDNDHQDHHDHHPNNNHHDQTNNNDVEKIELTNSLSEFIGLRPVEDELDYFDSTVSELRIIDPFKTPQQSSVIPEAIVNHHHPDHLHHSDDDDNHLPHNNDPSQIISQIDSLSQYKSTVTTGVRELLQYDQAPAEAAVFPAVELTMYQTPASVSVASSQYQSHEVKRLQVMADTEATYYPGHQPPVTSFVMDSLVEATEAALYPGQEEVTPQVSPPVAVMRQSVIRLNQKIKLRKM